MLQGTLKTFSLTGLLQMCTGENSTGSLNFFVKGALCGAIGFEKGTLISARFFDLAGVNAIRQIALLQSLEFQYDAQSKPAARNIDTEVDFLIIDLTRYLDECTEYLSDLKHQLSKIHSTIELHFCRYDHPLFKVLHHTSLHYLEWMEETRLRVIYFDRKIDARVDLFFEKSVTTDYLLMCLRDKGMIQ